MNIFEFGIEAIVSVFRSISRSPNLPAEVREKLDIVSVLKHLPELLESIPSALESVHCSSILNIMG